MKSSSTVGKWIGLGVGLITLAVHVLATFLPESMWSVNSLGLLPFKIQLCIVIATLLLLVSPWLRIPRIRWANWGLKSTVIITVLVSGMFAYLCYAFPITFDGYGDAKFIKQDVDLRIDSWDGRLVSDFLNFNWFDSKVGLQTFYQTNNLLTWLSGWNGTEVTPVFQALFAFVYALLWSFFCSQIFSNVGWRMVWLVIGITAPLTAVFMGHYETYFMAYTSIVIWFVCLERAFRKQETWLFLILPIVFLLVLKTHITNWMLLPSLMMAILWFFKENKSIGTLWKTSLISPMIVVLAVIGLMFSYFFVFENHDGPRQFSKLGFEDALFLPLYTDESAPLDRYNLFSAAHLLDFINLLWFWSGAVLLLAVVVLTYIKRLIAKSVPLQSVLNVTLIIYLIVFFFLNPLLGMSIDWDLFAIPGVIGLMYLAHSISLIQDDLSLRSLAGPIFGLCLLGTTFQMVNANEEALAERYGVLGRHNFKTSWIGSSTVVLYESEMQQNLVKGNKTLLSSIEKLRPWAEDGNDREYCGLLLEAGLYERRTTRNLPKALHYFEEAERFSPNHGRNLYHLTITQFELGRLTDSYKSVKRLANLRYPPYDRTLRMGVHISLAAKEYQSAADFAVTYLRNWPEDPVISEIEYRLRTGDRIEELYLLFDQS